MEPSLGRRDVLRIAGLAGTVGLVGYLGGSDAGGEAGPSAGAAAVSIPADAARQYSSPGCSCCSGYAEYLRERVAGSFEESRPEDVAVVKREHGVPVGYRSCHTVVLEEYVVEGHVPASAILALLDERPAIDGIALPGMPAGSPGMGGQKRGPFEIYVVGGDRTGEVFARA